MQKLLVAVLALLVSHAAGGLAGRLAGSLALAAATLSSTLLKIRSVDCLDVFHDITPPKFTEMIIT